MQVEKEDEECKYRLVGVVIHTGSAESGHYYSYIRAGKRNESALNPLYQNERNLFTKQERWLEFNDTMIRAFNFDNLESECFGGS